MKRMRTINEIQELAKSSTIEVPREFDVDNFIPKYVGDIKHAVCKITNGKSIPDVDFSDDGVLELLVYDNNFFKQIWHPISNAGLTREYQRSFSATTFKPWRRVDKQSTMIPSQNVVNDIFTTPSTHSSYTTPANGYIRIYGESTTEQYFQLNGLPTQYQFDGHGTNTMDVYIPVAKGKIIDMYSNDTTFKNFKAVFIYAEE